jgi:FkbM family methyltransferase
MPDPAIWFFAWTQKAWIGLRDSAKALLGPERAERLIAASGIRGLKSRHWRFEKRMPDGSLIRYRPADQCIIDEIYDGKAYGSGEEIRPGQTVVDVGGHIGSFSLWAARRVGPSGRVIVCEPGPDNLALLRANLERNALPQIKLHACALGDHAGEAELFIADSSADNPAANTLVATTGRKAVKVPLRTLDQIADEEKLTQIDHLKIDVEGAEMLVLKGAPKALKLTSRVVLEIHAEKLDPQTVVDFLSSSGFTVKILSKKPNAWLAEARR